MPKTDTQTCACSVTAWTLSTGNWPKAKHRDVLWILLESGMCTPLPWIWVFVVFVRNLTSLGVHNAYLRKNTLLYIYSDTLIVLGASKSITLLSTNVEWNNVSLSKSSFHGYSGGILNIADDVIGYRVAVYFSKKFLLWRYLWENVYITWGHYFSNYFSCPMIFCSSEPFHFSIYRLVVSL